MILIFLLNFLIVSLYESVHFLVLLYSVTFIYWVPLFLWSNLRSKWNEEFGSGAQLFFYLADEAGNALDVSRENLNIHEDSLLASGSGADIGDWQLHLKSKVMIEHSRFCYLYYHWTFFCIDFMVYCLWLTYNSLNFKEARTIPVSFFETV